MMEAKPVFGTDPFRPFVAVAPAGAAEDLHAAAEAGVAEPVQAPADADVPCAPVLQLDELWQHEQIAAVGAIREFDHVVLGPIRQPRPAPRFDGEDQPTAAWAPTLGQHTDDILEAAGLSSTEIKELRADGVIG